MTTNIPSITILCMETPYIDALNSALTTHYPSHLSNPKITLSTLNASLHTVPPTHKFDCIVSPANSYGLLDGAFDDAISRTFCLRRGLPYETLTHGVQDVLYEKYRGFALPGSATLVRFPPSMLTRDNDWGCGWIAICPTMRVPGRVDWDREVVYECVWSLLCEIEGFNRRSYSSNGKGKGSDGPIKSVLMTPLATGCGKVSKERWAAQVVMALKHFVDAVERPERWGRLTWMECGEEAMEVAKTH